MSNYLEYRRALKNGTVPQAAGKRPNSPQKEKAGERPAKEPDPPKRAEKGLSGKYKARIKTATKKRQKQNRAYTKVKKKFLTDNPTCQANLEGCTHVATDLHHIGGRTGENLLKVEDFAALCRNCHDIIHKKMSAKQAKKLGLKK